MAKFALPILCLLAISAFGYYSILGLTERNGWGDTLRASLKGDEPILPVTGEPLRRRYTGFAGPDATLTMLVRFFYSCAVGESAPLSVFTVYFAGQIVPAHAVLVLEGLRAGNKGTALYFPAIWGITYQLMPFGITLPIYCAVHLWRSPLARISKATTPARSKSDLMAMDPAKLSTITGAMVLGFVVPTVLPTIPASLVSTHSRQAFLALWQIFPLCVSLSHRILTFLSRAAPSNQSTMTTTQSNGRIYRQLLVLAGVVHLGTLAYIFSPSLQLALLGPSAVPVGFESVARPMSAFSPRQIEALWEGTHTLLQYDLYCGSAAAFVWAISLSYAAAGSSLAAGARTAGKLLARSLLVGPGGAVLWAFWDAHRLHDSSTTTPRATPARGGDKSL